MFAAAVEVAAGSSDCPSCLRPKVRVDYRLHLQSACERPDCCLQTCSGMSTKGERRSTEVNVKKKRKT